MWCALLCWWLHRLFLVVPMELRFESLARMALGTTNAGPSFALGNALDFNLDFLRRMRLPRISQLQLTQRGQQAPRESFSFGIPRPTVYTSQEAFALNAERNVKGAHRRSRH
jgi:hypothetical protein